MATKRLLLIDDDAVTLSVVGKFLERQGYSIHKCSESGEAVSQALRGCWDLVLLDLRLPSPDPGRIGNFDGLKLLSWIKQLHPATAVILYTASVSTALTEKAKSAGATELIRKGESPDRLLETIRTALAYEEEKPAPATPVVVEEPQPVKVSPFSVFSMLATVRQFLHSLF